MSKSSNSTPYELLKLKALSAPWKKKCRHNGTWLVAGGHIEWCYECGAIRKMSRITESIADTCLAVRPVGQWIRPVGIGKKNPWSWRFDSKKKVKE